LIAHERFWKGGVGRVAVIWATSKDDGAVPLDIERPVDLAVLTSLQSLPIGDSGKGFSCGLIVLFEKPAVKFLL
jgi:hypothetical protein